MTIQVPKCSCCRAAKVTRHVSSCLNTRACEAPGCRHAGALEETIALLGSCCTSHSVNSNLPSVCLPESLGVPCPWSARRPDRGCVTKVSDYALDTAVGQTLREW